MVENSHHLSLNYHPEIKLYTGNNNTQYNNIDENNNNFNNIFAKDELINRMKEYDEPCFNDMVDKLIKEEEEGSIKNTSRQNTMSNLPMSENTLPGLIISAMVRSSKPLTENEIYEFVFPKFKDLRKPDGSKYKGKIDKVIRSTLGSSGFFCKNEDNLWMYKEKEAISYIVRTTEKMMSKKIEKEKKSEDSYNNNLLTKRKRVRCTLANVDLKTLKVKNVLDEIINDTKPNKEAYRRFKSPFNNVNSVGDLIKKLGEDENKLVGILMCYKFFRPLINKVINNCGKKQPKLTPENFFRINGKIEDLTMKVENLITKRLVPFNNNETLK